MKKSVLIMTRLIVLEEACRYFNETTRNNRTGLGCKYYPIHEKSEGCAVGRLIEDKELCRRLDNNSFGTDVSNIFNFLPTHVQELGEGFLMRLQALHDADDYWNGRGLSELGKMEKELIIKAYCQ